MAQIVMFIIVLSSVSLAFENPFSDPNSEAFKGVLAPGTAAALSQRCRWPSCRWSLIGCSPAVSVFRCKDRHCRCKELVITCLCCSIPGGCDGDAPGDVRSDDGNGAMEVCRSSCPLEMQANTDTERCTCRHGLPKGTQATANLENCPDLNERQQGRFAALRSYSRAAEARLFPCSLARPRFRQGPLCYVWLS